MRSFLAALRTLVLPYGRSTGARIILDGTAGTITAYDADGKAILVIDEDGFRVQDGDNPLNNLSIEPDPITGFPRLRIEDAGDLRYQFTTATDGSPVATIRNGSLSTNHSVRINVNPTVGSAVDFGTLVDYIRIAGLSAGDLKIDTNAGQTLQLNPDGGVVTYNGYPVMRVVGSLIRNSGGPAPFTAETVVDTITATDFLRTRAYRISWDGFARSTVAGDRIRIRIREDDILGAILGEQLPFLERASVFVPQRIEGHKSDAVTSSTAKNFVVTIQRFSGTGSITAPADATQRVFGYVTEFG